jgi:hypothetical protein
MPDIKSALALTAPNLMNRIRTSQKELSATEHPPSGGTEAESQLLNAFPVPKCEERVWCLIQIRTVV